MLSTEYIIGKRMSSNPALQNIYQEAVSIQKSVVLLIGFASENEVSKELGKIQFYSIGDDLQGDCLRKAPLSLNLRIV